MNPVHDVPALRWEVHAAAGKWAACLASATAITKLAPDRPLGWIHRAESLERLGRTAEAEAVSPEASMRVGPNERSGARTRCACPGKGRVCVIAPIPVADVCWAAPSSEQVLPRR